MLCHIDEVTHIQFTHVRSHLTWLYIFPGHKFNFKERGYSSWIYHWDVVVWWTWEQELQDNVGCAEIRENNHARILFTMHFTTLYKHLLLQLRSSKVNLRVWEMGTYKFCHRDMWYIRKRCWWHWWWRGWGREWYEGANDLPYNSLWKQK